MIFTYHADKGLIRDPILRTCATPCISQGIELASQASDCQVNLQFAFCRGFGRSRFVYDDGICINWSSEVRLRDSTIIVLSSTRSAIRTPATIATRIRIPIPSVGLLIDHTLFLRFAPLERGRKLVGCPFVPFGCLARFFAIYSWSSGNFQSRR